MKTILPLVQKINALEDSMRAMSDSQLQAQTPKLRAELASGKSLDDILPEAFATCREASRRVLGMRHYDVQLIGGYVLHKGSIAEMRTGEGKTLVATLPVYLNALSGKGVHVVSVNDYLITRDAEWMGRIYTWLGLTVGIIVHGLTDEERKASYNSDITYATNNELGFDYLRDNMKFDLNEYVQREHNFAIVDECDSILIDEARTPLIISGPAEASTDKYVKINGILPQLVKGTDFTMEEKTKTASLTEEGNAKVEKLLGLDNLYDAHNIELLHHVYQALKAHYLYRRDVEYMVSNGEVVIVDEFTGRLMPGRRWSDGLHQAIEAKEGVEVKNENQTLATITFQNFFRMYNKMSGMTGTADTEAVEFKKIYNLDVVVIPTNKSIARTDQDDVVYKTVRGKYNAIAEDVKTRHEKGQPVLVGTVSIEKSEALSALLKKAGIRHDVLNAKAHEREAEIVAQAGRKGAITIATNMAGRGTDIVLGGNAEIMAKKEAGEHGEDSPEYQELVRKYKAACEKERDHVVNAGGLYIVGTERHESRRIDNQLRGRSGRQGDPGESKFYLSLEDDLMRIFNGERMQKLMDMLKMDENEAITHRWVTNSIEQAQRKVEGHHFDVRKNLIEYDDVMNQQRKNIYLMRREILEGKDLEKTFMEMLSDVVSFTLDTYVPEKAKPEQWNLEGLNNSLSQLFGFRLNPSVTHPEKITEEIKVQVKAIFEKQKTTMGQFFEQILKMILLQTIDQRWKEHLLIIDKLKEGINLRGYAQKDPLIEYKKEAYNAFENLHMVIRNETVEKLMKVQLMPQEAGQVADQFRPDVTDLSELEYQGGDETPAGILGLNGGSPAPEAAPSGRRKMTMGPQRESTDAQNLNRAQRRKMEKENRKR